MSSIPADLEVDVRDGAAWLIFNRPQKANALTTSMLASLEQTLSRCANDAGVRALVLTGSGERAFCAGADLTHAADNEAAARAHRSGLFAAALIALVDFNKPTIAAVNGAACGYGMMLALCCDAVIAVPAARFSLPEINKGTTTQVGVAVLTKRFGSAALAADLVLSGRFIGSEEALRRGLLGAVLPADQLRDSAQEKAVSLSANNPRAYFENKQWLNRELHDALLAISRSRAQRNALAADQSAA